MASSDATQRAVLAGLSCGIGLAAPVVMYAATLPFSSVNETVVAGAVPFAVGAVAGVGAVGLNDRGLLILLHHSCVSTFLLIGPQPECRDG